MARRLIITAGWLAAAILAVLVGLVAISVIGDGITSPITRPMSQSDVERELAAQPTASRSASPSPSPSSAPSPSTSASAPRSFPTAGGTVVARCVDGAALIVSMSPAQGFEMHEHDGGPQDDGAEGEFRGIVDDHDRVKIEVTCGSGAPEIAVRTERGDDD